MDLYFTFHGNLIYLQSQMSNAVTVTDTTVSNVTGGSFYVKALDRQNTVTAKLTLQNLTTNDVNAEHSSFILLYEGAELEIHNSHIKKIY